MGNPDQWKNCFQQRTEGIRARLFNLFIMLLLGASDLFEMIRVCTMRACTYTYQEAGRMRHRLNPQNNNF
jgi:hypothetical protein